MVSSLRWQCEGFAVILYLHAGSTALRGPGAFYGPLVAALVTGGNGEVAFPFFSGILVIGSFVGWKQDVGIEDRHAGDVDIAVVQEQSLLPMALDIGIGFQQCGIHAGIVDDNNHEVLQLLRRLGLIGCLGEKVLEQEAKGNERIDCKIDAGLALEVLDRSGMQAFPEDRFQSVPTCRVIVGHQEAVALAWSSAGVKCRPSRHS